MMGSIFIDIVTITTKIDDSLLTTLENVSQQSYENINHIIIYREANDKKLAQLQTFIHRKNLLFYPQIGKGISSAFNNGINLAQGELILFLNSGDTLVADDVIERVIDSYTQNKWLWATGETISVSKNKYLKKYRQQYQTWTNSLFWYGNPVCHQSTFYSRKLISQVGLYNESLSLEMDYDYNVRANQLINPTLLYFPIAYYDTTGVSSIRVFKQFTNHRRIRDRYFQLSKLNRLKVDTYCLLKSILRLAMIPAKLWL
jgi:glycosyltransferase involved in cell wall biosynthesis